MVFQIFCILKKNIADGWSKSAILNSSELIFFTAYPSLIPHILFYINGPAIWHGFPDITHIEVNNGRKLVILSLIELKFLRVYLFLKQYILFHGN